MKDERVVRALQQHIKDTLVREFNYCGVAEGETPEGEGFAMLNSGEGNIKIQITWERETKDG
jgi:hypothetical protein